MKEVVILIPEGELNLSSVVGTWKIFRRANEFWINKHGSSALRVRLAGVSSEVRLYDGLFSVFPEPLGSVRHADLLVIPSINKDYRNSLLKNAELIQWIKNRHTEGAEVASICTGAFLLAATGLLNGRQSSTHWVAANDFRRMFPEVELVTEKILTYDRGIYTNGGAYSFLNLVLHLVDRYFDRQTALYCSKVFQIDFERSNQSRFALFNGQRDHGDELVLKAQESIERRFAERISFEELANQLAVSRRNFDRRFIRATENTPVEYLQRVRVEAAKGLLETGYRSVADAMFEVGYSDAKTFREVFRRYTGLSPQDYREKLSLF